MIATTIEQSQRLLELGLEPKTADMLYYPTAINEMGETMFTLDVKGEYIYQEHDDECITAWSLSALLEVMRKINAVTTLQVTSLSTFMRSKDMGFIWQHDVHINDTVTAAYEMVCWLLEQGLIKKGGEE